MTSLGIESLSSRWLRAVPHPQAALPPPLLPTSKHFFTAHLTPRPSTPIRGEVSATPEKVASPTPAARIDDSPPPFLAHPHAHHIHNAPSVGIVAARLMELEAEPERWWQITKLWYVKGLAMMPGMEKLHHDLGLLSWENEGNDEELRGIYHFIKG